MKVMLVACESCRVRKRKCDRAYPSCSLCQKAARVCSYALYRVTESIPDQSSKALVTESYHMPSSKKVTPSPWDAVESQVYISWAIQAPAVSDSYPIASRWYMPRLIKHFVECHNATRVPINDRSSSYKLQTTWMRGAMSDPCLFHATLFTGSSNFDLRRGVQQSTITLYHYNELIKLVKKRLSDPKTALDDRTIAAITPLALFAVLTGDRASAEVHRAGLAKIVQLRGGLDKLGLEGLTASLIYVNGVISDIVFDMDSGPLPHCPPTPPLGLEERVLSTLVSRSAPEFPGRSIQALFQYIQELKLQLVAHRSMADWGSNAAQGNAMSLPTNDDPVCHCCSLAFRVFHAIITGGANMSNFADYLDAIASDLRDVLALTEDDVWMRHFPAVLTWACITGAAAASDPQMRAWFYFRAAAAVGMLDDAGDLSFHEDMSSHFHWLRSLRREVLQYDQQAL
ncbi:hypothetical protein ASPACDRAFT_48394 [Aspergillus aculeatus ATCC 16872]|uniref:Zn(2)-C6 fungal-type domain-containing protein n=1 Tax=Aspergillus aculeatus (strain ATCC 16872 / CBS 172.66 / WB 5094) TaxID=690307 RepID=A0A1L9WFI8_ASPA1|nr:uncharacterized protein ASPACDRAFT_48394 [Aspergillus aculeatus ATCC 16872]OJJ94946.1 hypothetical protein ASPACDRAFT_48394 [Aspergillus aculeatus ATCC 16872]